MSRSGLEIPAPRDQEFAEVVHYASGGEAEVYSATYVPTGQRVAIKVLRVVTGAAAARARREARFVREATILREITHPHVVRVYELLDGTLRGEPTKAFVMEWLPLQFGDMLNRQPDGLPAEHLGAFLQQALSGLGALHASRVAVRDLRRENLLLSDKGVLKLADLGMARTEESAASLVESSRYVAPEILDGTIRAGRQEDPPPEAYFSSDLYSLGFIFYEAAVGVERWERLPALESVHGKSGVGSGLDPNQRWREWHVDRWKVLPPVGSIRKDLDAQVCGVLDRMVEKDRARRYGSVEEALRDLGPGTTSAGGMQAGYAIPAPSSSVSPEGLRLRVRRWLSSRRRTVRAGGFSTGLRFWWRWSAQMTIRLQLRRKSWRIALLVAIPAVGAMLALLVARVVTSPDHTIEVDTSSHYWEVAEFPVLTEPAGAQVYVNEEYRGLTPLRVAVSNGDKVSLRRRGYAVWEESVKLNSISRDLSVRLEEIGSPGDSLDNDEHTVPVGRYAGERLEWTVNGAKFAFRWIPKGSFRMGSPVDEPCRQYDEEQHTRQISRGFWMQETEVTQAQWLAVMGSIPDGERHSSLSVPVQVEFESSREFFSTLNTKGLGRFRLPTECEWEYAARAGYAGPFGQPCGDLISENCEGVSICLNAVAWYQGNLWEHLGGEGHLVQPVALKSPNRWGLYDMLGNVSEWVAGLYADYPQDTDHFSRGMERWSIRDEERVQRGGGSLGHPRETRVAARGKVSGLDGGGVRCVLDAAPEFTIRGSQ